ncbi:MAG: DUF421 domain-containing protein [Oscillospiraceae bacterium]|nr:DUF421 domain-containing protein [Oscillospiraceae bacterium]
MTIVFFRTLILYICVVAGMRIMGKRQVGEMTPSELVVTIMISELASQPAQMTGMPLINGIIPIMTLVVVEITVSFWALKSIKMRTLLSGKPSVVVEKGIINWKEMEKIRLNIDDLMEELRLMNCFKIADVKKAIVETNGKLSVETN